MGLVARVRELLIPPDRSTEHGRSQARHRAIALTAAASGLGRGISILTVLVSIPLTLHYLGTERFGMWMTLSAFSMMLGFTDFGIGNSLLTAVARSSGQGEASRMPRLVASAYAAMLGIAGALLAILLLAYGFVSWPRLFNVASPLASAEAGPSAAVFFAILALTTPLTLIYRIQLGLQQGFRASLWQSAGNVAALIALVVATELEASLQWLVLALVGAPLAVALVNTLDFFTLRRPDLRPRFDAIDHRTIRQLASGGALFLILQVCAAVLFQSNPIIIAQLLGADAVASFAVPDRMFAIVGVLMSLVLTPLWPAYGEAAERGDIAWVRRTLRLSIVLTLALAIALASVLVLFGPALVAWWVGSVVVPPFALFLGLGVWKVIEAAGNTGAMFLNGVNELKIQVAAALACVLVSVPLRIWWTQAFGLSGVIWATVVSYALVALPFMAVAVRRELARMQFQGLSG